MLNLPPFINHFIFVCSIFSNLSIIVVAYITIQGYFYKKIKLSIGSFRIRRKEFTVQNITNLVSLKYYDGGEIPPSIRKEILIVTCPMAKSISEKRPKSNRKVSTPKTRKTVQH